MKNEHSQCAFRLRPATPGDVPAMIALFRASVHEATATDYDPRQRAAWAPDEIDPARWERRLAEQQARIAERAGEIAGFCTWTTDGYLDLLYVHPRHLRNGAATALCTAMEADLRARHVARVHTQASVTAQPFFRRQGFRLVQTQVVEVRGVALPNAVMEKFLA